MKKYILFIVSFFCFAFSQESIWVTFKVDMQNVNVEDGVAQTDLPFLQHQTQH